jgi:hypothetical protein
MHLHSSLIPDREPPVPGEPGRSGETEDGCQARLPTTLPTSQ